MTVKLTSSLLHSQSIEKIISQLSFELEEFQGICLGQLLDNQMDIETFLTIAINLTEAVQKIHNENIIHKDLNPQNIFIHPTDFTVKIAGFNQATGLPREKATNSALLIESSLPYISPELTGRMNRNIDNRTDLYSLGIIFFKMLTLQFPFQAKDLLEWIHCHVARPPLLAHQINTQIPPIIAEIINRLLGKMADDRYQSAKGLKADLETCFNQWKLKKSIDPFELGSQDVTDRFIIPQKIYGRDKERFLLIKTFHKVLSQESPELLLISGYSGIGKTALVHELNKPILNKNGFFVSGKFDQFKRDIPYSAFVQTLQELVKNILAQSEDTISKWKEDIQTSLKDNGQLIIDVIPQVELLIGAQPPVAIFPLHEAQNRFKTVFRLFIEVFAKKNHPLTFFLDDLQWADAASLNLIKDLVSQSKIKFLFIIGAYRDNEVSPMHPLSLTLKELNKSQFHFTEIFLDALQFDDLNLFISETLHQTIDRTAPLSILIKEKTGGNPFFTIQFLLALHENQLLVFDTISNSWKWDTEKIRLINNTDNVIDLLIKKIMKWSFKTQKALRQIACMGHVVDIDTLCTVYGTTEDDIQDNLWDALVAGIIQRQDRKYKFIHDRLHEACYLLIPQDDRPMMHLEIARALLRHLSLTQKEENLFEIVGHLEKGSSLIIDIKERNQAAKLNLQAANKARASIAFSAAIKHCQTGLHFLDDNNWSSHYDLNFSLRLILAECEFVVGIIDEAQNNIEVLLSHVTKRVDQARVRQIQMDIFTTKGQSNEALQSAIACLRLYELHLSPHPTDDEVKNFNDILWKKIDSIGIHMLSELPLMKNNDIEAAIGLLCGMLPSAYFTDINLHRLLCCHIVNFTLIHGVCSNSLMGFAAYGLELSVMNRFAESFQFGNIANQLIYTHGFKSSLAKVANLRGSVIIPWSGSLQMAIEAMSEGIFEGSSDTVSTSLALSNTLTLSYISGENLLSIKNKSSEYEKYIRSTGYGFIADISVLFHQLALELMGIESSKPPIIQDIFPPFITWRHLLELELHVYLSRPLDALASSKNAKTILIFLRGQQAIVEHAFFSSLAITASWSLGNEIERVEWKKDLNHYLEQLRLWSEFNPQNFSHRLHFISAEIARIEDRPLEAQHLYERAIQSSLVNNSTNHLALCFEKAATFYQERSFNLIAETYFQKALYYYEKWGAAKKVKQLEVLLSHKNSFPLESDLHSPSTKVVHSNQIDFLSTIKASQAISSEIVLDGLILKLLEVILEQSGAERSTLILNRNQTYKAMAYAHVVKGQIKAELISPSDYETSAFLPVSMIRYVQRTNERLLYDNASLDADNFISDPYIIKNKPKSVLCLPIKRGNHLTGILYLENSMIAGIFSLEKLEVLELLASQAAISLENVQSQEALRVSQEIILEQKQIALIDAQKTIKLRDDFISLASHELRTPLTPLKMCMHILKKSLSEIPSETFPDQEIIQKVIGRTDGVIYRLSRLTEDLLDVSLLTAGKFSLMKKEFDLSRLLNECIQSYEGEFAHNKSNLKKTIQSNIKGYWDIRRLEQIIDNLLTNAIKYGNGNEIEISLIQFENNISLSVRDHGTGIANEKLSRIFERFDRVNSLEYYPGLGLGLYISQEIARAHGGLIEVESELDKGSKFTLNLPIIAQN